MAVAVKEKSVLKKVRKALISSVGGTWKKIHGGAFQDSGILDLVGCVEGFYIEIEVKTPRRVNRVSGLQKDRIVEIKINKGLAFVTCDPKQAVSKVKTYLKSKR